MNLQQLFETMVRRVSADAVLENTQALWHHARGSDFAAYQAVADEILQCLHEAGLDGQRIQLPADGKTHLGDAVMPLGWYCKSAQIETLFPEERLLITRDESPYLVGMWSPGTPPEGLEGELIVLEKGEPYEVERKTVDGAFLLTPGRPEAIRRVAAEHKAAGVISYYSPTPNSPHATGWIANNSNAPGCLGAKADETPLILLSVPPSMGQDLRKQAKEESVRLRVQIDATLEEGALPLVEALIEGADPQQEVWLHAPTNAPGAHYNAFSAATLLEIARLLKQGIDDQSLPQPLRSIRLLFLPKPYGALAYAASRCPFAPKAIQSIYLESGAGNPDFSWSRWTYRLPPAPLRHFSDVLTKRLLHEYGRAWRPQRPFETQPTSLAGDLAFLDPRVGIPTSWIHGGTEDELRHSSLDRPESIDRRAAIDFPSALAASSYAAANVGIADIPLLANWNISLAFERLQEDLSFFIDRTNEAQTDSELQTLLREAKNHIQARVKIETGVLEGLAEIDPEAREATEWDVVDELRRSLREMAETCQRLMRTHLDARASQLGIEFIPKKRRPTDEGDQRVPQRSGETLGYVTLESLPAADWTSPIRRSPRTSLPYMLSWWLVDDKRTIAEIDRLVRLETPRFRECLPAWFNFLERHGYITFEGEEKAEAEEEEQTVEENAAD